jgi:hypothetical protein
MTAHRRTRREIAVGRLLRVGQACLRHRDGTVWRVRQVHRADCLALLERDGEHLSVGFGELRVGWVRVTEEPW